MTKLRKMAAIGLTLGILFGCTSCGSKPDGSAASSAGEASQMEAASASAPAVTAPGTWSLAGNFLDESENHLMIYKTSVKVAADYVRTNGLEITKFQLPGGTPVELS